MLMVKELSNKTPPFIRLKDYIIKNSPKLPDGTPIFSARFWCEQIDEAKAELWKAVVEARKNGTLVPIEKAILKWFGKP